MNESKYYIPNISEFYVGFEYEIRWILNNEFNTPIDEVWLKAFVPLPSQIDENWEPLKNIGDVYNSIVDNLQSENIRVKCLDEEDILSFFGACTVRREEGMPTSVYSGFLVDNETRVSCLFRRPNYIDLYLQISPPRRFSGIVKNKSELSKLFKQLGI